MLVDDRLLILGVSNDILVILLFQDIVICLHTVNGPPGNCNHRVAPHEREDEGQCTHQ